jgi:flagellar biosynthesis protein FlhG
MTLHTKLGGPRLTAIGGGKGGTGKTFLAVNLAHALACRGERVLLCDADFGLSNSAVHLGMRIAGDFAGLMAGHGALCDAVMTLVAGPRATFDLLASAPGTVLTAHDDAGAARQLVAILRAAEKYDRVLIDLGAGIAAPAMTFATRSDETLVVLTPDPASLTDAYAFIKTGLRLRGGYAPSVIVNMASGASEARRCFEALEASARAFLTIAPDYLGFVPRDSQALQSIRLQTPLLKSSPQSTAALAIAKIALGLHEQAHPFAKRVVTIR